MSFRSVAAKNVVLRMVGVMTVAGAALVTVSVPNESFTRAQPPQSARQPNLRLPDEAAVPRATIDWYILNYVFQK
jgi:hypothetical protein